MSNGHRPRPTHRSGDPEGAARKRIKAQRHAEPDQPGVNALELLNAWASNLHEIACIPPGVFHALRTVMATGPQDDPIGIRIALDVVNLTEQTRAEVIDLYRSRLTDPEFLANETAIALQTILLAQTTANEDAPVTIERDRRAK